MAFFFLKHLPTVYGLRKPQSQRMLPFCLHHRRHVLLIVRQWQGIQPSQKPVWIHSSMSLMSGQEQNDYMRQMGVHLMFFPLVQKSLSIFFWGMLKTWPVTRFVVKHIQLVGTSNNFIQVRMIRGFPAWHCPKLAHKTRWSPKCRWGKPWTSTLPLFLKPWAHCENDTLGTALLKRYGRSLRMYNLLQIDLAPTRIHPNRVRPICWLGNWDFPRQVACAVTDFDEAPGRCLWDGFCDNRSRWNCSAVHD